MATMRARVASARVGYLGTVAAGAGPHVVPVCFALVGSTAYTAIDDKPKRTTRLRRLVNIRSNPAACLLVSEYHDDWSRLWWIRLDGTAAVVTDDAERESALDALAEKYVQYADRRPRDDVIVLEVERWSGWAAS